MDPPDESASSVVKHAPMNPSSIQLEKIGNEKTFFEYLEDSERIELYLEDKVKKLVAENAGLRSEVSSLGNQILELENVSCLQMRKFLEFFSGEDYVTNLSGFSDIQKAMEALQEQLVLSAEDNGRLVSASEDLKRTRQIFFERKSELASALANSNSLELERKTLEGKLVKNEQLEACLKVELESKVEKMSKLTDELLCMEDLVKQLSGDDGHGSILSSDLKVERKTELLPNLLEQKVAIIKSLEKNLAIGDSQALRLRADLAEKNAIISSLTLNLEELRDSETKTAQSVVALAHDKDLVEAELKKKILDLRYQLDEEAELRLQGSAVVDKIKSELAAVTESFENVNHERVLAEKKITELKEVLADIEDELRRKSLKVDQLISLSAAAQAESETVKAVLTRVYVNLSAIVSSSLGDQLESPKFMVSQETEDYPARVLFLSNCIAEAVSQIKSELADSQQSLSAKITEVCDLSKTVAELECSIEEMNDEKKCAQEKIQAHVDAISDLQNSLTQSGAESSELRIKLNAKSDQVRDEESRNEIILENFRNFQSSFEAEIESTSEELKMEMDKVKGEMSSLQADFTKLKSESEALELSLSQEKELSQSKSSKLSQLEFELHEVTQILQKEKSLRHDIVSSLESRIEKMDAECKKHTADSFEMKLKHQAAEKSVSQKIFQIKDLEEEFAKTTLVADEERERMLSEITGMKNELSAAQVQLEAIQSLLSEVEQQKIGLEETKSILEAQVSTLVREHKSHLDLISELQFRVENLTSESQEKESTIESLQEQVRSSNKNNVSAEASLAKLQVEKGRLEVLVQELKQQKAALKETHQKVLKQSDDHPHEKEQTRLLLGNEIDALKQAVAAAENNVASLEESKRKWTAETMELAAREGKWAEERTNILENNSEAVLKLEQEVASLKLREAEAQTRLSAANIEREEALAAQQRTMEKRIVAEKALAQKTLQSILAELVGKMEGMQKMHAQAVSIAESQNAEAMELRRVQALQASLLSELRETKATESDAISAVIQTMQQDMDNGCVLMGPDTRKHIELWRLYNSQFEAIAERAEIAFGVIDASDSRMAATDLSSVCHLSLRLPHEVDAGLASSHALWGLSRGGQRASLARFSKEHAVQAGVAKVLTRNAELETMKEERQWMQAALVKLLEIKSSYERVLRQKAAGNFTGSK